MKVTKADVILSEVPPGMSGRYTLRVKKATYAPSSKGNPQVALECEIIKPLSLKFGEKTYALDSFPVRYWFPVLVSEGQNLDEEATKKVQGRFMAVREKFGLDPEFDTDTLDAQADFQGKVFDAILNSIEDKPQRKNPDTGKYVPILDAKGVPVSKGYKINAQAEDILGLSQEDI